MIKELNIILSGSIDGFNYKQITTKEFEYLIGTEYSSAFQKFKNGDRILRGEKDINPDSVSLIKTGERFSQNTSNIYTLLLSEILPSWKEYPKRNHSVICTSESFTAMHFGRIYYIFPKNGTKLGICPDEDFWYSFKEITSNYGLHINMDLFNHEFIKFARAIGFKKDFISKDIFLEYFEYIKNIDINNIDMDDYFELGEFGDFINYRKDLLSYIDKLLNPTTNSFQMETIENYKNKVNREIWFDGEFIAIPDHLDIYKKYKVLNYD